MTHYFIGQSFNIRILDAKVKKPFIKGIEFGSFLNAMWMMDGKKLVAYDKSSRGSMKAQEVYMVRR